MSKPKADDETRAVILRILRLAEAEADRLDPDWKHQDAKVDDLTLSVVSALDGISSAASRARFLFVAVDRMKKRAG